MNVVVGVSEEGIPQYVSDITEKWLESVLASTFDRSVTVHSVHKQRAVGKGDNFVTNVTRVKVDVTVGGERRNVSLVIKTAAESEAVRAFLHSFLVFKRECYVYSDFLPYIAQHFNNHSYPLHYYGRESGGVGALVLEDLTTRGFVMRNKKECMSLAEARSALVTLAKLHAHGHVMTTEDRFKFQVDLVRIESSALQEFEGGYTKSIQTIVSVEFPELQDYAESLRNVLAPEAQINFYYKHPEPGNFATIIHGDAWSNNMMFKYHGNRDPEVKLVDWQMTRPNSGVLEIAYFLHSSTDSEFRAQHVDYLLRLYLKTYIDEIKRYKPIDEEEYTFDKIKQQYEDHKHYRFLISLTFSRLIHDDVLAISSDINSEENPFINFPSEKYDKSMLKYLKSILHEFIDNGLLQRSEE